MHCVKSQHFFQNSFAKIRQSEVCYLDRRFVNSENATFIQEETFKSYGEYFVEALRSYGLWEIFTCK